MAIGTPPSLSSRTPTNRSQDHWSKLIAERIKNRNDYNLSEDFVRKMMDAIHQESIRHQTRIMNPEK